MRRRLNVPDKTDVLAYAASLPEEERLQAEKIIEDVEIEALDRVELQPGKAYLAFLNGEEGERRGLARHS